MGKTVALSRRLGEQKAGRKARFFVEEQFLGLEENMVEERGDTHNMELEGTDIASWAKKTGLWVVPKEQELEVLRQHYDGLVTGH